MKRPWSRLASIFRPSRVQPAGEALSSESPPAGDTADRPPRDPDEDSAESFPASDPPGQWSG